MFPFTAGMDVAIRDRWQSPVRQTGGEGKPLLTEEKRVSLGAKLTERCFPPGHCYHGGFALA